eukprot:Phypoly_transcript_10667.p1 GENE.Phypoly_transcript_10667~~Phypoly_transcript_10667.p1  ORF type:complete len:350 (+),score=39.00 Phypoly_transcript_10667:191-1240(+)
MPAQPFKRKACGPCIALKAKCEGRPCVRCVRRGALCYDVARKPRAYSNANASPETIISLLQAICAGSIRQESMHSPSCISENNSSFSPPPNFSPQPTSDNLQQLEQYLIGTQPTTIVPPTSPTQLATLLNILRPFTNEAQVMQTVSVLTSLDALINFTSSLIQQAQHNTELMAEVRALKKVIDEFMNTFTSLPQEIQGTTAMSIVDPQTVRVRDCNESFLRIFGTGLESKHSLLTTNVKNNYSPFLQRLVMRDLMWFAENRISVSDRYLVMPHPNGNGVLYGLAGLQILGPNYSILTVKSIFADVPYCLQVTFDHYLGLHSVNKTLKPSPECPIKYCHCKMLHLPLPRN